MLIPTLYLIIAGQVALVLVFLIGYLIYMLVSEENRWEAYTDKLKGKIRELQEYKDRFDVVSENLHKQMETTKELTEQNEKLSADMEVKDNKIAEHEALIAELQKNITELQEIINNLEAKEALLDEANITITELKTQISILEDKGAEFPEQINGLNITIENLETENNDLKVELNTAQETVTEYQQKMNNSVNDNFNLTIESSKPQSDNQFDLLNNIKSRYEGEMERLKKNFKNQKHIIDDLEAVLMSAKNSSGEPIEYDTAALEKLQQMLSESNTVVEMLEGEIDTLQAEINQLMMQNEALTKAITNQSTTDNTADDSTNITDTDNVFFSESASEKPDENATDDVFFSDTPSSDDSNSDDVFFDATADEDDVFFDMDAPPATEAKEIAPANSEVSNSELEQLQMQLDGANQMAMTLMMTSGDQGNIINFARNSIAYETLEDLAKGILETVSLFQVNGALQLRGDEHDPLNMSSFGKLSSQDNFKLTDVSNDERFEQDGSELLIRFKMLSLLIKELPLEDNDKVGRIRDNMAIAMELACANLNSIEASIKIKKNQKVLNQVLKSTYHTIQNVEEQFNEQNTITNQVINSLTGIISNPAMTEGMDPIYKDVFTSVINDGKKQFDAIKEKGVAIDGNFSEIVRRLGSKIND